MHHFKRVFFFFSSRRRHTRLQGDWSSDVCSSDLRRTGYVARAAGPRRGRAGSADQLGDATRRAPALLPAPLEYARGLCGRERRLVREADGKSTRLNSSHLVISYAVFCLKKKKPTSGSRAYRTR